jgi:hypothetical protein
MNQILGIPPIARARARTMRNAAVLAAAVLFFAACASAPQPPTGALDAAQSAIVTAERANAGRFAASELGEARDKLAQARDAVEKEEMLTAKRLADESRVTAELASARTESAKALAINTEMERSVNALDEELQRAGDRR